MIKKKINRRSEHPTQGKPTLEHRFEQATKTVVETYKQNSETAVYTKYYEYKKKQSTPNDCTPGGL